MSDKLKNFIQEHRQEFDSGEPPEDLWNRIEAKLEIKGPSRISSKWLSRMKYLGFGLSILIVAFYFILHDRPAPAAGSSVSSNKDSAMYHPTGDSSSYQNVSVSGRVQNSNTKETYTLREKKTVPPPPAASLYATVQNKESVQDSFITDKNNAVPNLNPVENNKTSQKKNKTNGITIPPEPAKMNTYTGTFYEASSFCSLLLAFKFPGKVNGNKGKWDSHDNKANTTIRTINCSLLGNDPTIRAIWLKGKSDKEITLPVKKDFKNILLIKKDGRRLNPEAISHYYPGLGVISEYKGTGLNLVFQKDVELILFFKNAGEGDRIAIDGVIEAEIKNAP